MRFISILTAITLAFGALTMSVSAAESGKASASAQQSVNENAVLSQKEWDGKAKLKADTCYFIKKNASVTLSGSKTLPASSMIVVENGGKLTVKKDAKLYVKGAVIVHSGGTLAVDGMAVFKSGSAGVINGKMTVGSSGRLSVYGDIQISKDGLLGIRGRAALHGDGRLLSWGRVKKLAKSARVPAYTKRTNEMPLYYAEECSQYLDSSVTMFSWGDDMGLELTDSTEKLELLRTFEAVLYKYDGAFKNEDMWALNNYYEFAVGDPADSKVWIGMNNHNIKTFNVQDGEEAETISGNFYAGILGRPDGELFARIDPTSPEYVHSEYF